MMSAIPNTPDRGRPNKGLVILAEKGDKRLKAAFDRLRPIFEELDKELGSISRIDKAQIVGKISGL